MFSSPGLDPLSQQAKPDSIVGAELFHFSVRNGKRWCQLASKTEASKHNKLLKNLLKFSKKQREEESFIFYSYSLTISTGRLNTLLYFHRPPINLMIYQGSTSYDMKSYLRDGFPLRCFQRLSVGNLATRQCWNDYQQPTHQGFPHPSPLVLGTNLLKFQTVMQDRDRTGLRRSEPSSRTLLTGEQPDPWDLLQPQDRMSRHRIFLLLLRVLTIPSPARGGASRLGKCLFTSLCLY